MKIFKLLTFFLLMIVLGGCEKENDQDSVGDIFGKVTDVVSGKPINSAKVLLSSEGKYATTGEAGTFQFKNLPAGEYVLQVEKDGYETKSKELSVVSGDITLGDISILKQEHTLEVDPMSLELGVLDTKLFSIYSHYGETAYQLKTRGDASWLTFTETSGFIPEYDKDNAETVEEIVAVVTRDGLPAGNYTCTLIIESDLADIEIPVSMTVEAKRYLEVYPKSLELGTADNESFLIYSYNGTTSYEIKTRGDATWLTFSEIKGTIPAYDKDDSETIEYIEVFVNRDNLAVGNYNCTIIVRSDLGDIELPISMVVEEKKKRVLEINKTSLAIGTGASGDFTIKSLNGASEYKLHVNNNTSWLTASEPSGTILEYDPTNPQTVKSINLFVNREGLAAGSYSCTLVVSSPGLVDYEMHVSMSVKENETLPSIISCDKDIKIDFVNLEMSGSTAVVNFTMTNNGADISTMYLQANSMQVYDDLGNSYTGNNLKLGSKDGFGSIYLPFPSNIKMRGSITIKNVDASATSFQKIITSCRAAGNWEFDSDSFTFENVKITR